jgi:nucleoid DNA-binding protein
MSAASKPKTPKARGKAAPITPLAGGTPPGARSPTPKVVDGPQSVILGPMLRKKELLDAVVERAGVKKKDAKPVVESMLAILGEALADSRELNLPPLGRIKVRREKPLSNGRMMVVKVRQSRATLSGPSAKAATDGDSDDRDDD